MENLLLKTDKLTCKVVKSDAKRKMFAYRIQGGIWCNYYADFDAYYLSISREVAEHMNIAIAEFVNPDYPLVLDQKDKNGNIYDNVSLSVKAYENAEKIGKQTAYLTDVVLKVSEFTFGKKVGLSKSILAVVVGQHDSNNWLAADDDFEDVRPEFERPVAATEQPTDDAVENAVFAMENKLPDTGKQVAKELTGETQLPF